PSASVPWATTSVIDVHACTSPSANGPEMASQPSIAVGVSATVPTVTAGSASPTRKNPVPVTVNVTSPCASHTRSGATLATDGGGVTCTVTTSTDVHPAGSGFSTTTS